MIWFSGNVRWQLNISRFYEFQLWSLVKTRWRIGHWSQNTWLQVAYLCTDIFNLVILPRDFVMQRQILINVVIFVACVLNLLLNPQRPHYRWQRAGKWSLIFGSWQSPDILRSHFYRSTIAWTPPTAIYREYTVFWFQFHWSLFPRVQLTIHQYWFR